MVPNLFVFVESFPLTPNGKIDRRALPTPSGESREKLPAIIPPKNDVERHLVQIWEDELAVRPISVRDNFFDLGGHSLLAVRVFARMEQLLGVRLPLAELFQTPTVEGLAEVIRGGTRSLSWRSLVPIQAGGSRLPLFAVPGVGGNVLCYADLARLLAPEQPFYGLQSQGLSGTDEPLTSIEDIAAAFLREIRQVQPSGPYYLLGACMGGVIAYEMAQQLRAAGQAVGSLIFLETWLPATTDGGRLRPDVRTLAALDLIMSRLRVYINKLTSLRGRQRLDYLLERVKMLAQMVVQRDAFRGDRSEFHLRVVTQANLVALRKYRPNVYDGRVVLFRAEDRRVMSDDDPRLAWSRLVTGDLEVHSVPGNDSGTMLMKPYVCELARKLGACIKGAKLIAAFVAPAIEPIRLVLKMVEGT
jgi:thioesterase domain-containing protein/acyl carrier protein